MSAALKPSSEHFMRVSPWLWAYWNKLQLVGSPFMMEGHEYQVDVMQCQARRQVAIKGAQMAFTESLVLITLHGLRYGYYPRGVLYLFPTADDVTDFSASRFKPLLTDNLGAIGKHIRDTDRAHLKRIGRAYLYFRGAYLGGTIQGTVKTSSKLKSIPVDKVIFDEMDEMEPAAIDLALQRMAHSKIKEEWYLSTPSLPDYGVDLVYQQSDQRHWFIQCLHCGHWTCMELEFPGAIEQTKDGRWIRACKYCHREIFPRDGAWRPLYPKKAKDLVGWHISQLNSMFVEPGSILKTYNDPPGGRLAEVYRSMLGRSYVEAENRLSITEVEALCKGPGIPSQDRGPCSMGIDQGNDLHVVIGKPDPVHRGRIVHIGIYKEWEELDGLMRKFHVNRCVVDALPETRNARAFAGRHKGKIFISYYNEHQKGNYKWNEEDRTVQSNRTESLDASHIEIQTPAVILPALNDATKTFARQLHNIAKKLEEDPETGSRRYVYIRLGTDHYRHAYNYEVMARHYMRPSLFDEFDQERHTK